MPQGGGVSLLVELLEQDGPGLEAGPVQPLIGAPPVMQASLGHTGSHAQQTGSGAQVTVSGEGCKKKKAIKLYKRRKA